MPAGSTRSRRVALLSTIAAPRLYCLALTLVLAVVPVLGLDSRRESQLKSAIVYRFLSFVEPRVAAPESQRPWVIGIMARDPLPESFTRTVTGKLLKGRLISVLALNSPDNAARCDVVFLDAAHSHQLPHVLRAIADRSVLVVGEGSAFLERGGMIALMEEGDRIQFEVNLAAAERAGLQFRAQLLKLARQIITK